MQQDAIMEYIYDKLRNYSESGYYGFHMPGHKRNRMRIETDLPYEIDITEIDGFDDLHHASGIIREGEMRAAELYGAEETHYLVNGSTVGLLSAVMGCTKPGDRVLVARNCHKSVYNAIYMNDLKPVYVYPDLIPGTAICGPVKAEQVAALLNEWNDVKAVIITSPTYDGVVSDVRTLADEVHRYGVPLILDEAHGAHFGFHPYFPENGNMLGADLVIHSLHKTMPSLTQTALIHLNGNLVDREPVRRYLHMLQSSSPSYILMAAIDESIRMVSARREEMFGQYVSLLEGTRERLSVLEHLHLFDYSSYDRSKLLIDTSKSAIIAGGEIKKYTGKLLSDDLRRDYLIEMEMSLPGYTVGMTSVCDTKEGMDRLVGALYEIDGKLANRFMSERNPAKPLGLSVDKTGNRRVYSMREIDKFTNNKISVLYADAEGTIAMEFAYVYPPGIPLVTPGERISAYTAELLQSYADDGFDIEGTKTKGKIEVLENG